MGSSVFLNEQKPCFFKKKDFYEKPRWVVFKKKNVFFFKPCLGPFRAVRAIVFVYCRDGEPVTRTRIFVTQVGAQHRVKTKLHDEQVLRQ